MQQHREDLQGKELDAGGTMALGQQDREKGVLGSRNICKGTSDSGSSVGLQGGQVQKSEVTPSKLRVHGTCHGGR